MLLKLLNDFAISQKLMDNVDNLAFTNSAIRWIISLNCKGNLIGVGPYETQKGRPFSIPQTSQAKNAGGVAEFLVDDITGLFGLDSDPEKGKDKEKQRIKRDTNNSDKYEDYWRQILKAYHETQSLALFSMLEFNRQIKQSPKFLRWGLSTKPKPNEKPAWWLMTASGAEVKLGSDNFTFQVEGFEDFPVNDETLLRPYWRKCFTNELTERDNNAKRGLCLITGDTGVPIAETHIPKISNAPHIQSFGAGIVSFDKPAFSSYGFKKSYNSPSSTKASMGYSIALNYLLSHKDYHFHMGETSVCFWAKNTPQASRLIAQMYNRPSPINIKRFLAQPWTGLDRELIHKDKFYSITLSSNAGRIVIRHWLQITVEEALENFQQWFSDLKIATYGYSTSDNIDDEKDLPPLGISNLACCTVRDKKELQSEILTQLYCAALNRMSPSTNLLKPILNRLYADISKFGLKILETPLPYETVKKIRDSKTPIPPPGESRIALLKLILNRNIKNEDVPVIEPEIFETTDKSYNCGRLLAVLANTQQKAHDFKLEGPGVAERYYGRASSSPGSVLPLLIRLNRHHLNKISKSERFKGDERYIEEHIQNIIALFRPEFENEPPNFPRSLNLQDQGRFAIGFYQQQAADFAARNANKKANDKITEQPQNGDTYE